MANKNVFGSAKRGQTPVPATAVNHAGGRAFSFSTKHALAQFACTGTFNDTFYQKAAEQVDQVLGLCKGIDDVHFLGKVAVYAREKGYMKDMPALICAHLTTRGAPGQKVLERIFPRVIDNGKMLRNFVQIIRSGKLDRKSLGTQPQRMVRKWFSSRNDEDVFRQSVGNDPSMADIIKLVRPRPVDEARRALYGYLLGIDPAYLEKRGVNKGEWGFGFKKEALPPLVQEYETFKALRTAGDKTGDLPKVPMEMLSGLANLTEDDWKKLALQASWTQTRMNLNTFARHGVFKSADVTNALITKLTNPELIGKSKVFPYQLMMAFLATDEQVPEKVRNALQDAMELAVANVPVIQGRVVVMPDVSGSMGSSVTGVRAGSTSKVRCIDIAALVAAVFMRKCPDTLVLPFEHHVNKLKLNPRDSIMTNAEKLSKIGGGGTNCSAPLAMLNRDKEKVDYAIYISDNESWMDSTGNQLYRGSTGALSEWNILKARCPKAKLVCLDIQANDTTQALERGDILNIGGFSDNVFEVVQRFVQGDLTADHWVGIIEGLEL